MAQQANRPQWTETLAAVALDLSQRLESPHIYESALTHARRLIGYDRATILEVSDGVAHLVAVQGTIGSPLAEGTVCFPVHDDPIVARWHQRTNITPELIADTHTDPRWHQLAAWRPASLWLVGSWIGAPLYDDATLIGILCLERHERHGFAANDALLAGMLASRLAVAMRTSHLLEAERARARQHMDFAATVAHELRSPITTMLGYAEILRSHFDQASPEQRERWLGLFRASSVRLQHLVDDILTVSSLEAQSQPVTHGALNVNALIQQALDELSVRYPHLSLEIVGTAPAILANHDHTVRILINLLDNAAKYGGETGKVRIRLSGGPRFTRIAVRDFGPGIPPQLRERLFTRFGKGEPQGQASVGLGLYICQGLARSMGGTIAVYSTPDRGSLFLVSLPRAAGLSIATGHDRTAVPEGM
jgi:signal transduction histidine kinase